MIRILLLVGAVLLSAASWAGTDRYNPKSPALSAETDPQTALRDYPLGVIPKRVAFFRHGPPHKTVTLTNGDEGWVYEIPRQRKSYTLVFCDGVVSDVIYKDDGPGTGVTATEMQAHKAQPMAETPPFLWTP